MIRYRLACGKGHEFDAWFASSTAYEAQEAEGLLNCPHCANTDVARAIMAPRVSTSRHRPDQVPTETTEATPATDETPTGGPATPVATDSTTAPRGDSPEAQRLKVLMREMRTLRDQILETSEDIGPRFAQEVRRIHEEGAPDRAIHGQATAEEVRELAEDGIDVLPIPRLPDDLN